jgi:uncharacterized protein YfdQ (DUF2303 family)
VSESVTTEAYAINGLATSCQPPYQVHGKTFITVPDGYKVECFDRHMPAPMRKSGTVTLNNSSSFVAFIDQHKTDSTSLYFNDDRQRFIAVFNDHSAIEPGWRDFTAVYNVPLSREWHLWNNNDEKRMIQEDFARFIEDNLPDIVDPPGSTMLEVSRSLEAHKSAEFKSGIRLSNGSTEFTYNEEVKGTAAKGTLAIPETFQIGIPVLKGGPGYRMTVRFRYRIDGGKLALWYELLRPHKVLEDALDQVAVEIADETGLTVLAGTP